MTLSLDGLAVMSHGIRGDWSLPSGSPQSNEGDRKVNRQLPHRVMRANRGMSRGLREHGKRVSFPAIADCPPIAISKVVQGKQYFQLNKVR